MIIVKYFSNSTYFCLFMHIIILCKKCLRIHLTFNYLIKCINIYGFIKKEFQNLLICMLFVCLNLYIRSIWQHKYIIIFINLNKINKTQFVFTNILFSFVFFKTK